MSDFIIMYGASDDLIEIRGAISEEFAVSLGGTATIEFSNGDAFTFTYDGEWRIEPPAELAESLSGVQVLAVGDCTVTKDYSQTALYEAWRGVDGVELVSDERRDND